jgi:hypothetical protein
MMRTLGWSAVVTLAATVALSGCGGEAPEQAPTPTTAPSAATPPSTAAGQAAGDEDLAAPLLVWADSDTDEGEAPLTVQFEADVEGGTAPLKYKWTFGDGQESAEPNPKHTYEKPGEYRADLVVNDSADDEDSDYLEIEVYAEGEG